MRRLSFRRRHQPGGQTTAGLQWGRTANGQAAANFEGHESRVPVPLVIPSIQGIKKLTGGIYQTYILTKDGKLFACGSNGGGQMANGDFGPHQVLPEQIVEFGQPKGQPPPVIKDVEGLGGEAMCLTEDGRLFTWGPLDNGNLGVGVEAGGIALARPARAATGPSTFPTNIIQLAGGSQNMVIIKEDVAGTQTVWRTGSQNGRGPFLYFAEEPGWPVFTGAKQLTKIVTSFNNTLILLADGTVLSRGRNQAGQLGTGKNEALEADEGRTSQAVVEQIIEPLKSLGLPKAIDVAISEEAAYALLEDGTVLSWGLNHQAQLGNGEAGRYSIQGSTTVGSPKVVITNKGSARTYVGQELRHASGFAILAWKAGTYQTGQTVTFKYVEGSKTLTKTFEAAVTNSVAPHGAAWSTTTKYKKGEIVTEGNSTYEAIVAETKTAAEGGKAPSKSVGTEWRVVWQVVSGELSEQVHLIAGPGEKGLLAGEYEASRVANVATTGAAIEAFNEVFIPTRVTTSLGGPPLTGIVAISANSPPSSGPENTKVGSPWAMAKRADGTMVAWGSNEEGQVGDGTVSWKLSPAEVLGGYKVDDIFCAEAHGLAIFKTAEPPVPLPLTLTPGPESLLVKWEGVPGDRSTGYTARYRRANDEPHFFARVTATAASKIIHLAEPVEPQDGSDAGGGSNNLWVAGPPVVYRGMEFRAIAWRYPEWTAITTYRPGDIVSIVEHTGTGGGIESVKTFECIKENTNADPRTNPEDWVTAPKSIKSEVSEIIHLPGDTSSTAILLGPGEYEVERAASLSGTEWIRLGNLKSEGQESERWHESALIPPNAANSYTYQITKPMIEALKEGGPVGGLPWPKAQCLLEVEVLNVYTPRKLTSQSGLVTVIYEGLNVEFIWDAATKEEGTTTGGSATEQLPIPGWYVAWGPESEAVPKAFELPNNTELPGSVGRYVTTRKSTSEKFNVLVTSGWTQRFGRSTSGRKIEAQPEEAAIQVPLYEHNSWLTQSPVTVGQTLSVEKAALWSEENREAVSLRRLWIRRAPKETGEQVPVSPILKVGDSGPNYSFNTYTTQAADKGFGIRLIEWAANSDGIATKGTYSNATLLVS